MITENSKIQTNPVKVIRAYCLACCLNSSPEVARCPAIECELWPWRFGKNPYRAKRVMSEEQKQKLNAARERFKLNQASLSESSELETDLGNTN